jgi:hypothetical protein
LLTAVTASAYLAAPVLIVGLVAPVALPIFALMDKLQKQVISGTAPLVSVFQGWTPRASLPDRPRRTMTAFIFAVALSLFLSIAIFVASPWLVGFLGAGLIKPGVAVLLVSSLLCGAVLLERIISRACLVVVGGSGRLALATAVGSGVGIALLIPFTIFWGPLGGVTAVLGGLIVTLCIETIAWSKLRLQMAGKL